MKYYFLQHRLYSNGENKTVEPNPIGNIVIFESPDIDINKVFDVHFTKTILNIYYERISKNHEYKIVINKKELMDFNLNDEAYFQTLDELFINNIDCVFKSKSLAIKYAINLINNMITIYSLKLKRKYHELYNEKSRYVQYGKLLKNIKIEMKKQEKNSNEK